MSVPLLLAHSVTPHDTASPRRGPGAPFSPTKLAGAHRQQTTTATFPQQPHHRRKRLCEGATCARFAVCPRGVPGGFRNKDKQMHHRQCDPARPGVIFHQATGASRTPEPVRRHTRVRPACASTAAEDPQAARGAKPTSGTRLKQPQPPKTSFLPSLVKL